MRSKYMLSNNITSARSESNLKKSDINSANNSKMTSKVAHYRSIGSIDSEASLSSCSVSDQEYDRVCNSKNVKNVSASRRAFSVSSTTSSASLASNTENSDRKFYHRFFKKINNSSHKSESYSVNQSLGMISTIGVRVEVESSKPTEYSLAHLLQSISFPFSAHRDEPSLSLVNKAHTKMIQLLRSAIDEQRVNFHTGTAFFKHIFDTSVAQLWVKVKFASRDKSTSSMYDSWSYFFLEDFHTALLECRRSTQTTPYDIQMLKWSQKRTSLATETLQPAAPFTAMGDSHIRHLLRNFSQPEFENQTRQQQTVLNLYAFLAPLFSLEIVDLCFVLRYDTSGCDFNHIPHNIATLEIGKEDDRASSVTSGCSSWVPSEDENNKPAVNSDDCDSITKKEVTEQKDTDEDVCLSLPEAELPNIGNSNSDNNNQNNSVSANNKTKAIKSAIQVLTFSNVRAMKRFRLKTRDSPPQRPHSTIIESAADVVDGPELVSGLKSFVSVDNLGATDNNGDRRSLSAGSLAFCRKLISKTRSMLSVDKIDSSPGSNNYINGVTEQPSPVVSSGRCSTSSVASSAHSSRLFGVDIADSVPVSILCLIKAFVLAQGLVAEGIFRKSANARNCRELRKLLEDYEETIAETAGLLFDDNSVQKSEEELLEQLKEYSVHEMASTLKEFVRQLPSGAVAPECDYDRLREIADDITKLKADSNSGRQKCIDSLRTLINRNCNAPLLSILLSVLYQVCFSEENVKENLMSPNNLAVCIGASLISASLPPNVSPTHLDIPKSTSNLKLLSMSSTSIRDLFLPKANSQMTHHSVSNLAAASLATLGLEPERISALVIFLIENCDDILGPDTSNSIFKLINVDGDKKDEFHDNYINEELEDEVFFDDIIAEYGPRNSTAGVSTANFDETRSITNLSGDLFDDYYEDDTINASDCTVRSIFQSNYETFHKYCSVVEQKRAQIKERIREESKHPLVLDDEEDEVEDLEKEFDLKNSAELSEDQPDSPKNPLAAADYRAEFGRYVAKDSKIRLRKFRSTSITSAAEFPRQTQSFAESEPVTGIRMRELGSDDDDVDSSPPSTPSAPQTLSRFFVTATIESKPNHSSNRKNPIRGLFRKNRQRYSLGAPELV